MPHTYIQDNKKIVDDLCKDDGLILEEKLILLAVIKGHITAVTEQLESEQARDANGHKVN